MDTDALSTIEKGLDTLLSEMRKKSCYIVPNDRPLFKDAETQTDNKQSQKKTQTKNKYLKTNKETQTKSYICINNNDTCVKLYIGGASDKPTTQQDLISVAQQDLISVAQQDLISVAQDDTSNEEYFYYDNAHAACGSIEASKHNTTSDVEADISTRAQLCITDGVDADTVLQNTYEVSSSDNASDIYTNLTSTAGATRAVCSSADICGTSNKRIAVDKRKRHSRTSSIEKSGLSRKRKRYNSPDISSNILAKLNLISTKISALLKDDDFNLETIVLYFRKLRDSKVIKYDNYMNCIYNTILNHYPYEHYKQTACYKHKNGGCRYKSYCYYYHEL